MKTAKRSPKKFCYECGAEMRWEGKNKFDSKTGKELGIKYCSKNRCHTAHTFVYSSGWAAFFGFDAVCSLCGCKDELSGETMF